jgi:hypothetical protein
MKAKLTAFLTMLKTQAQAFVAKQNAPSVATGAVAAYLLHGPLSLAVKTVLAVVSTFVKL